MFKWITVHLTGPICNCEEQNLSWSISDDKDNQPQLSIECLTCKTVLTVPNEKFTACVDLDKPYPGNKKKNQN